MLGQAGWGRGQAGEEAGWRGVPWDSVTPADGERTAPCACAGRLAFLRYAGV